MTLIDNSTLFTQGPCFFVRIISGIPGILKDSLVWSILSGFPQYFFPLVPIHIHPPRLLTPSFSEPFIVWLEDSKKELDKGDTGGVMDNGEMGWRKTYQMWRKPVLQIFPRAGIYLILLFTLTCYCSSTHPLPSSTSSTCVCAWAGKRVGLWAPVKFLPKRHMFQVACIPGHKKNHLFYLYRCCSFLITFPGAG